MNIPECFYRVSIKALVLNDEGRFMLLQEADGKRELPGGGLDHGECSEDGLAREIAEEMHISVTSVDPRPVCMTTHTMRYGEGRAWRADIVYAAQIEGDNFTPTDECVAIGYFTVDEARELDVYPSTTKFLDEYEKVLAAESNQ